MNGKRLFLDRAVGRSTEHTAEPYDHAFYFLGGCRELYARALKHFLAKPYKALSWSNPTRRLEPVQVEGGRRDDDVKDNFALSDATTRFCLGLDAGQRPTRRRFRRRYVSSPLFFEIFPILQLRPRLPPWRFTPITYKTYHDYYLTLGLSRTTIHKSLPPIFSRDGQTTLASVHAGSSLTHPQAGLLGPIGIAINFGWQMNEAGEDARTCLEQLRRGSRREGRGVA